MKSMLYLLIAAGAVWWLFFRPKSAGGTGVIQGDGPDFDPITADQLLGLPSDGEAITTQTKDPIATSTVQRVNSAIGGFLDGFRSHASEPDETGGIPL